MSKVYNIPHYKNQTLSRLFVPLEAFNQEPGSCNQESYEALKLISQTRLLGSGFLETMAHLDIFGNDDSIIQHSSELSDREVFENIQSPSALMVCHLMHQPF